MTCHTAKLAVTVPSVVRLLLCAGCNKDARVRFCRVRNDQDPWCLTVVYGPVQEVDKAAFLEELRTVL